MIFVSSAKSYLCFAPFLSSEFYYATQPLSQFILNSFAPLSFLLSFFPSSRQKELWVGEKHTLPPFQNVNQFT